MSADFGLPTIATSIGCRSPKLERRECARTEGFPAAADSTTLRRDEDLRVRPGRLPRAVPGAGVDPRQGRDRPRVPRPLAELRARAARGDEARGLRDQG